MRSPEAQFSSSSLEFTATKLGEILTQTITITNSTPETILTGTWEVVPHPSDPPYHPESHAWISFDPPSFSANHIDCQIIVDPDKLVPDATYERQLLLHTNSETYSLPIKVKNIKAIQKLPYISLSLIYTISILLTYMITGSRIEKLFTSSPGLLFILLGSLGGAIGGDSIKNAATNVGIIYWNKVKNGAFHGGVLGFLLVIGTFIGYGCAVNV